MKAMDINDQELNKLYVKYTLQPYVLVEVSIAVKRPDDHSHFYKGNT